MGGDAEPGTGTIIGLADHAMALIARGGPAMAAIAVLSVLALALVLWKTAMLLRSGAWSGAGHAERAVQSWEAGDHAGARALLEGRRGLRARLASRAMAVLETPGLSEAVAREETARAARALLNEAHSGLRGLELTVTIGPLLGLLGTVTGMIEAFPARQEAGSRADPAARAGGIWDSLLTTAAGMAVAIPAQVALTWFESTIERLRHDMEDQATRLFVAAGATRTLADAFEDAAPDDHVVAPRENQG
ncbi:MAG: MotA/TolQ/ExbB proton channel family protein [Tabrizicola sp.]